MVESVRTKTQIPLAFMTYMNPVHYYGYEAFFARCEKIGLDAIIVPDMPYDEKGEIDAIAKAHNIEVISLIAPTSEQRIQTIAQDAGGFIYVVSSLGVTGMRSEITTDLGAILKVIREATDVPAAIGFGINTPEQAENMARLADGVIVGSAIVKIVEKYGEEAGPHIYEYVKSMKDAVRKAN
jgi:tryptophan synthase alpha chain